MPTSSRETPLCTYHYDPLDRLVDSTPLEETATQRYYCDKRLVTEIEGSVQRSIVQHDDHLLAQQRREGTDVSSTMLATDQQRSVLNALDANQPNPLAYSPYGHRPQESGLLSLLGFNGERPDPVTGSYHLGNGYRQFNPALMRFNSPDSWSPFGEGGVNAYAYCGGDPINRDDPTGHMFFGLKVPNLRKAIQNKFFGRKQSTETININNWKREAKRAQAAKTKIDEHIKLSDSKFDTSRTQVSPQPSAPTLKDINLTPESSELPTETLVSLQAMAEYGQKYAAREIKKSKMIKDPNLLRNDMRAGEPGLEGVPIFSSESEVRVIRSAKKRGQ